MRFFDLKYDAATAQPGAADKTDARVPGRLEFTVRDVDVAYVNGLRRAIMSDVRTASFRFDASDPKRQDIAVTHNTGVLHNELIGGRLGLVPVHFNAAELAELDPEAWSFELDVSNTGPKPVDVTTHDIEIRRDGKRVPNAASLLPADPITGDWPLITVLMPSSKNLVQRLALRAKVSSGNGEDHARFCPVSVCAFMPLQDLAAVAAARAQATDVASFDAIGARRLVEKGADGAPVGYRFFLETACGLAPAEVVRAGLEALSARLTDLARDAEKQGEGARVIDVEAKPHAPDAPGLILRGESDTVGAIVQAVLLDLSKECAYVGYYSPHPTERSIVIRMKPAEEGRWSTRELLRRACEHAARSVEEMLELWIKAAKLSSGRNKQAAAPAKGRDGDVGAHPKRQEEEEEEEEEAEEAEEAPLEDGGEDEIAAVISNNKTEVDEEEDGVVVDLGAKTGDEGAGDGDGDGDGDGAGDGKKATAEGKKATAEGKKAPAKKKAVAKKKAPSDII